MVVLQKLIKEEKLLIIADSLNNVFINVTKDLTGGQDKLKVIVLMQLNNKVNKIYLKLSHTDETEILKIIQKF